MLNISTLSFWNGAASMFSGCDVYDFELYLSRLLKFRPEHLARVFTDAVPLFTGR